MELSVLYSVVFHYPARKEILQAPQIGPLTYYKALNDYNHMKGK